MTKLYLKAKKVHCMYCNEEAETISYGESHKGKVKELGETGLRCDGCGIRISADPSVLNSLLFDDKKRE